MRSGNIIIRDRTYRAYWYLQGQWLGTGQVKSLWLHGREYVPHSYVRVCPVCGNVWSQIVVDCEGTKFVPESRKCPSHGAGFIGTYELDYELPREVMLYEVKMFKPGSSYETFLITGGN